MVAKLTDEQKKILFEKGTEPAFSGKYYKHDKKGNYTCANCGQVLFGSGTKFDSKSGWPSFYDAVKGSVKLQADDSHGMHRTEVLCSKCGGHLGHLFEDGPKSLPDGRQATGNRYCINSACLNFKPQNA